MSGYKFPPGAPVVAFRLPHPIHGLKKVCDGAEQMYGKDLVLGEVRIDGAKFLAFCIPGELQVPCSTQHGCEAGCARCEP